MKGFVRKTLFFYHLTKILFSNKWPTKLINSFVRWSCCFCFFQEWWFYWVGGVDLCRRKDVNDCHYIVTYQEQWYQINTHCLGNLVLYAMDVCKNLKTSLVINLVKYGLTRSVRVSKGLTTQRWNFRDLNYTHAMDV